MIGVNTIESWLVFFLALSVALWPALIMVGYKMGERDDDDA